MNTPGSFIGSICLVALAAGGCLPVGNYHSARTLGKGESSTGLTFSSTTYTDQDGSSVTIPGIIPEIAYHIGVTEDVEIGGRVAPGFLYGEVDGKFRFIHTERAHVAIAPAIGQMAVGATLTTLRLPIILTYDLNDTLAFNASLNGTTWRTDATSMDEDDDFGFYAGDEVFVTSGGSVGLEIRGETAFFRPSFEFGTMVTDPGGDAERLKIGAVVLHFGWVSGREMKKLDEMDEKLDRIERKVGARNWRIRRKPVASAD